MSRPIIRPAVRRAQTWRHVLVVGLVWLLGLLAWQMPGADRLERDLTLPWLFASRGLRPVPTEAVIVSIDTDSARRLGLPSRFADWPRTVHADLIRRAAAAGAGVIAIDVYFARPRMGAGDAALASAIADAGNVVLFGRMDRRVQALAGPGGDGQVLLDRMRRPHKRFADAAAAVAPFVLPKAPLRVDTIWMFHPSAPTLATLPAAAIQVQARGGACPPTAAASAAQRAACDLAAGPAERMLNFYGPPWTVRVFTAAEVLRGELPDLTGRAVFIGHVERYFPNQLDSFPTVVGRPDGLDLSGVEIAATAYLNLLRREFLQGPPALWVAGALACSAVALVAIFSPLNALAAGALAAALVGGALLAVSVAFGRWNLWLPLAPWLVQIGAALVAAISRRARASGQERAQVVAAFQRYLPAHVVRRVARQSDGPVLPDRPTAMRAVCLVSDAAGYTAVGERLPAQALHDLANRYYGALLAPIDAQKGIVTDIVGDSALALWPAPRGGLAARHRACRAALGIQVAVSAFEVPGGGRLPTRIGLCVGELVLGPVGAGAHFEYRAIGDVVNTASRIEALNKHLGTQVLATAEVVDGLPGLGCRPVGRFVLPGKTGALELVELTGPVDARRAAARPLFEKALAACAAGDASLARRAFDAVLVVDPADTVARFYLGVLEQGDKLRQDGAVLMTGKSWAGP